MDTVLLGSSILAGAFSGFVYGVVGYYNEKKKNKGFIEFDAKPFMTTVLGSTAFGVISSYLGLPFDAVSNGVMGVAVTQFVNKLITILFKDAGDV